MPLTEENPITSYFSRLSPDVTLKTPIQSKLKLAKRARPVDETGSAKGNTRKKSKSTKQKGGEGSSVFTSSSRSVKTVSSKKVSKVVIEIQDSPPPTPVKPMLFRPATPPSSPLPDLTPSPEASPRTRSTSHISGLCDWEHDERSTSCGASVEDNYSKRQEVEPHLIPSSQTQAIDPNTFDEGDSKVLRTSTLPSSSSHSPQCEERAQTSSPQYDTTPFEPFAAPDEFISSSQTQLVDIAPVSPSDSEVNAVPSSQSQEVSYSQITQYSLTKLNHLSEQRTSLMGIYLNEPEAPACSPSEDRHLGSHALEQNIVVDSRAFYPASAIPSSQSSTYPSRPSSQDVAHFSSTQLEDCLSNGAGSYESLPDAVKEFQGMFNETFESLPADFPMSLRF